MDIKAIYDEAGGDMRVVAQRLGVPYETLVQPEESPVVRRRYPPSQVGNPDLKDRIVSIRHADNPHWPTEDADKITLAKLRYEAGTHEMCQGRDKDWFILYSIPRKVPCAPRKYLATFN